VETTINLHIEERFANVRQSVYAFVCIQSYPDVPPFVDSPRLGASSHGVLDQTQVLVQRSSLSIQFKHLAEMPRRLLDGSLDSCRRLYSVIVSRWYLGSQVASRATLSSTGSESRALCQSPR
jgi:hypothetical protein